MSPDKQTTDTDMNRHINHHGAVEAAPLPGHDLPVSLNLMLPPPAAVFLKPPEVEP